MPLKLNGEQPVSKTGWSGFDSPQGQILESGVRIPLASLPL